MSVVNCNVLKANLILAHFSLTMYFGLTLYVILRIYYIKYTRTNFVILPVTFYFFRPSEIVYERFFNDEKLRQIYAKYKALRAKFASYKKI